MAAVTSCHNVPYELILLQCYSAKELLESFSVDSNGLNLDKFEKVCPAIVQQIESKACLDESEDTKEDAKQSKARGITILIVFCLQ